MLGLVAQLNQLPTVNGDHGTLNCDLSKMKVDIYVLLTALTEKKVCVVERKIIFIFFMVYGNSDYGGRLHAKQPYQKILI